MEEKVLKRKVNEFCQMGNLEGFRDILTEIFNEIAIKKCKISTRTDSGPACHTFQQENCLIRIPILNYVDNPIDSIWVILHEFGHHLSGDICITELHDHDVTLKRERLAWDYARTYVLKFPKLADRIEEFDTYAESCLASYRKLFNK